MTTSARRWLSEDKLGAVPHTALVADEHEKNNLPDVLARWKERAGSERERLRTGQSFCVPRADIAAQGYDLSLNRYKESASRRDCSTDPPEGNPGAELTEHGGGDRNGKR